jgi:hypothetical protein
MGKGRSRSGADPSRACTKSRPRCRQVKQQQVVIVDIDVNNVFDIVDVVVDVIDDLLVLKLNEMVGVVIYS